jgi:hypothetical protein
MAQEANPFYSEGAKADADIRDWFGPSDIDDIILMVQSAPHVHGRGPLRTAFLLGQLQHLSEAVDAHMHKRNEEARRRREGDDTT